MNKNITKQELLSKLLLKKDAIAFRKVNRKSFSYIWGTLKELEEITGEETTLDDFRKVYFAQHGIKPFSDTSEEMIEACYENFKENAKLSYSEAVAKKTAMAEARWKKTRSSDSSIENNENVCYSTHKSMQEQHQQQEQEQEKEQVKSKITITSRERVSQELVQGQEKDNIKSQEQEHKQSYCKVCNKERNEHTPEQMQHCSNILKTSLASDFEWEPKQSHKVTLHEPRTVWPTCKVCGKSRIDCTDWKRHSEESR